MKSGTLREKQNINNKKSFGKENDYKKARQEGRRSKCVRKVTKDLF
jgi:hypothetical protein